MAKNVRINPENGEREFFFPLEVTDDSVLVYAKENGLEVGWARLGFREFRAVFVPCKDHITDSHGRTTYLDTPSEIQHRRYLDLIKDEMNAQEDIKQDGRCPVPDGHGGIKRCPCRIPNPKYVPGGSEPKTLPVRCEGCVFEPFKQAHTVIELSALDHENENGEMESFEVPAPRSNFAADRYLELRKQFVAFVKQRNPKLAPLTELLVDEFTKSEAGRELGLPSSTVTSRTDKLKELAKEFLDTIVSL